MSDTPSGLVWMEAVPAQFSGADSMGPVTGYSFVSFPVVDILPRLSEAVMNINENVSSYGNQAGTDLGDFKLWCSEQFSSVARGVWESECRLAGGNFPSLREWIASDWLQQLWPVEKSYLDSQTASIEGALATQSSTIQALMNLHKDYLELHLGRVESKVDSLQSTCDAILQLVGGLSQVIDQAKLDLRAEVRRLACNQAAMTAAVGCKILTDLSGPTASLQWGSASGSQVYWSVCGPVEVDSGVDYGYAPSSGQVEGVAWLRGGRLERWGAFWAEGDEGRAEDQALWLSEELQRVLTFPWRSGSVR